MSRNQTSTYIYSSDQSMASKHLLDVIKFVTH